MQKLLYTIVFSIISSIMFSQEFTWVSKPKISGYDEVKIVHDAPNFFLVKKNGKAGVVTPEGKEICPIIYDKISQVKETHFCAYHPANDEGKKQTWYSDKGKILDFDTEVNALHIAKQKQEKEDQTQLAIKAIESVIPGAKVNRGDIISSIISTSGDTIITDLFLSRVHPLGRKHVALYADKNSFVLDDNLDTLYVEDKHKLTVYQQDEGHATVSEKVFIHRDGDITLLADKLYFLRGTNLLYVKKAENECQVLDTELNEVLPGTYKYISSSPYRDGYIIKATDQNDHIIYLDPVSHKVTKVGYKSARVTNLPTGLIGIQDGENTGIYDIDQGKIIVPALTKYLSVIGPNQYVISNEKINMKDRNALIDRTVINANGQTIYSGMTSSISGLSSNHIKVSMGSEMTKILNGAGEEVYSYGAEEDLSVSHDWTTASTDNGKMIYPTINYINGDTSLFFETRYKKIDATDEYMGFYIVSQKGLKGFCDTDGNLLYPCELDEVGEMDKYSDNGYFLAKKDGSWGLMRKPRK